jgi:hypothetical protein
MDKGVLVTTDHGQLETAAEHAMFSFGRRNPRKKEKGSHRGSTLGRAPRQTSTSRLAPRRM